MPINTLRLAQTFSTCFTLNSILKLREKEDTRSDIENQFSTTTYSRPKTSQPYPEKVRYISNVLSAHAGRFLALHHRYHSRSKQDTHAQDASVEWNSLSAREIPLTSFFALSSACHTVRGQHADIRPRQNQASTGDYSKQTKSSSRANPLPGH